jgi:signal recognition particle receptor subunit beta
MAYVQSEAPARPLTSRAPIPTEIVVAGGFAVGKTTFVGSISEIQPLTTEAAMTTVSVGVDNAGEVSTKTATTVAMDFGRITLAEDLVLYLFGTPGQERFWFMWDELVRGAIGAIVLVDTRRLADCFAAIDYFERQRLPFIVAVNCFEGEIVHELADIREALAVPRDVPLVYCDARDRSSTKTTLIELVQHAVVRAKA